MTRRHRLSKWRKTYCDFYEISEDESVSEYSKLTIAYFRMMNM